MSFISRNSKYLEILPDGTFIFTKSLPLKKKEKILFIYKSLNETSLWNKQIRNGKTIVFELENTEVSSYRNKFKN